MPDPTPLPRPIGTYKTLEDAEAGFAEKEKFIGTLTATKTDLEQKLAAASQPKPPAFANDADMLKHLTGKGIDLQPIVAKAMLKNEYDDADMLKIGEVLKDADPKWLGKTLAQLSTFHQTKIISGAQTEATKKLGGEAAVKPVLEYVKTLSAEQQAEFAASWNSPNAEKAIKGAFADMTIAKAGAPTSPSQTATGGGGGPPSGFASQQEVQAARAASKAKYGHDYPTKDADLMRRLAATDAKFKSNA